VLVLHICVCMYVCIYTCAVGSKKCRPILMYGSVPVVFVFTKGHLL
jgi:hypothetical protein